MFIGPVLVAHIAHFDRHLHVAQDSASIKARVYLAPVLEVAAAVLVTGFATRRYPQPPAHCAKVRHAKSWSDRGR